jgi:hypothetical protein
MSNLWILTEERPKTEVITTIIEKFANDRRIACFIDKIRILPIVDSDDKFTFTYQVIGFNSKHVEYIYIKSVSGKSSFVDFLVFFQEKAPDQSDTPIYAIEETKTDDAESRNTGVFQRATKFVYIDLFYDRIDKSMLYNLQIDQKESPTDTNIFGSRCFSTLGVKLLGKKPNSLLDTPWKSIDEMIEFKANMRKPPKGNVPIEIVKVGNRMTVSGRLIKSGSLGHDPNIGALTLISATLRSLGWTGEIEIVQHGLSQSHVKNRNKFVLIANKLGLSLEGLSLTPALLPDQYWYYEKNSEKLGTIFVHVVVENFTSGMAIYENHAGCERGYFITKAGDHLSVDKKVPAADLLPGQNQRNIEIPDLVLVDFDRSQILNLEGKTYANMNVGIAELDNFDAIERYYIKKHYPDYSVTRSVVLYGGEATLLEEIEVCFLLNQHGSMVLGIRPPELLKDSLKNLRDYWS